jgi:hypothetical protein
MNILQAHLHFIRNYCLWYFAHLHVPCNNFWGHATEAIPQFVLFNFLTSIIITWRPCELLGWVTLILLKPRKDDNRILKYMQHFLNNELKPNTHKFRVWKSVCTYTIIKNLDSHYSYTWNIKHEGQKTKPHKHNQITHIIEYRMNSPRCGHP